MEDLENTTITNSWCFTICTEQPRSPTTENPALPTTATSLFRINQAYLMEQLEYHF